MKSFLLPFLFMSLYSVCLSSQNCADLKGQWQNELGSVLQIDDMDKSGKIVGVYRSSTGVDGKTFALQGWVNASHDHPKEINISFMVRWQGYGSITAWTGYCHNLNEKDEIKTIWNLVRSGKEHDWERIITNSSTFKPIH